MSRSQSTPNQHVEECQHCDEERPHDVAVDLLVENEQSENASYSREPYRVTECLTCGRTTKTRMNDA